LLSSSFSSIAGQKIVDPNIVIFSLQELQQDTYRQFCKTSFFLGFISMTFFRLLVLAHVPNWTMLIFLGPFIS
jgi:hypothetical protein